MKQYRRTLEKLMEGILFSSSTITSLTVILIVVFLFREGLGIFTRSPLDKNYVIAVSKANPVKDLSSDQLRAIFNQDITNWSRVGGKNDSIILFTTNDITNYYSEEELGASFEYLPGKLDEFISTHPGALMHINNKDIPKDFPGRIIHVRNISVGDFLFGKQWYPTSEPIPGFGIWPMIIGTLMVTFGALLIALPLGLATALFLAEVADIRVRNVVKPLVELLAGIPSVVFGFFGLIVIVPFIQRVFHLDVGETVLAGSVVLGIMALPTIVTIAEDALRTTPRSLKEASLALGATRWQTLRRVTIPYAGSGISAAVVLGVGRAIGETMAVLMVTGNASTVPHSFLVPARTMPATIAAELGEAPYGGAHFKALFALGIVLFLFTIAVNMTVAYIKKGERK
ncbi:MAG TPA: phosphate ABC transporter permease subunit PstC [Bacteroidales bacterium]|nr:phosphate ABC transporter permease subunit PstC [Bacteroidales bacterium]HPT01004.1 phosphate ABC transporter permease subunit PstC [Bacteroidales bacterium]